MAGFFERLNQVWKGFLGLWISDIEQRNPEAVYEAAIEERIKMHRDLKKAVSGIVYRRNKLQTDLEQQTQQLAEVNLQIPVAVEEGEDEAALVLIEQKNNLEAKIAETKLELEKVSTQAEEAKAGLIRFQGEIEKLKREKVEMLAKKANAEAQLKIQETLDGLSTDADIKALENVRESIEQKVAEADVGSELQGESLDQKLAKIKSKTANAAARAELDEMKKQMAAKKEAAAQASAVNKTI